MLNFGTQEMEYFCLGGGVNLSKAWIFQYVYLQIKILSFNCYLATVLSLELRVYLYIITQ